MITVRIELDYKGDFEQYFMSVENMLKLLKLTNTSLELFIDTLYDLVRQKQAKQIFQNIVSADAVLSIKHLMQIEIEKEIENEQIRKYS